MKRLQFRHNREVFQHRADVLKYFADIVDATNTASTIFNSSLYAEPLVAKYLDEDGNQQIILAIGVDSGLTPYHIIDSKEIAERLDANKEAIEAEVKRATEAETVFEGAITAETKRALEAELFLSGAVETERSERIAADIDIKTQIDKNIASIVPVTENLGANVREEYALKNAVGEELGSHIKIYKDSALVGAEVNYKGATGVTINDEGKFEFNYSGEADKSVEYLYLIYRNEEGGLSLVALDFENFLMETEEGYGIKIVDHKITINIKAGDKYLKVSEDGLQTINIDEAIKTAVDTLSEDINAKVDAEIERSIAADDYISGLTAEFSAATFAEFVLVNSAVTVETERAMAVELNLSGAVDKETARALEAELFLSGAVDTERTERIAEDDAIKAEIKSNKVNSKDIVVNKTDEGTSLIIQTDEVTLTKLASAAAIYDTNVAVLGTLLKVKEVEPEDTTIRFAYELQDGKGNIVGDQIKIPFESSLVKVIKGHSGATIDEKTGHYTEGNGNNTIDFVYRLADGTYSLTQIAVSDYFNNLKFETGLNVDADGTVKLVEGDGNEYLVIGEDTIAVVGVNNAIAIAKADSENLINEKYESATGYTDQRYNDSIAHTDTRVNSAVEGFNTLLTESIGGVNNSLGIEISNRENADNVLDNKISDNTTAISTLQSDHIAFSGSVITYINSSDAELKEYVDTKVNNKFDEVGAASSAETAAKEYADSLNAAMSERVVMLEADNHTHTNKVELDKIAEGDKAKWDNAVSRLDDFLIGNGVEEVIDTLQDIKDWMKGEGVVATELTEAIATESKLRENEDNILSGRIATLEQINHDTFVTNETLNVFSGNVLNYINQKDIELNNTIAENKSAIAVLNADKKTEGSVLYRIENEFEKSLITDGVPVTAVSPEEANKVHSLIRQITVNGEMRYYVVSDATEMLYVKPRATETAPIETVNLNDYITSLETRVAVLEEKLTGFAGNMEQTMKDLIKSYLNGTENEIKITETDDKLTIGFDDNAIFGEI